MKTLYFEGAGHPGADVSRATIGNCRIRTAFHLDDGRPVYLEIIGAERTKHSPPSWEWRYTGFVGEPLFYKEINLIKYAKVFYEYHILYGDVYRWDDGYAGYIAWKLDCPVDYTIVDTPKRQTQALAGYLDSMVDRPLLTKEERKPLIEHLNVRHNGKLCRSYKVLAAWLEGSRLPYRLQESKTCRRANGVKKNYRVWKVVKKDMDSMIF